MTSHQSSSSGIRHCYPFQIKFSDLSVSLTARWGDERGKVHSVGKRKIKETPANFPCDQPKNRKANTQQGSPVQTRLTQPPPNSSTQIEAAVNPEALHRLWNPTELTDPERTTFPRLSLTPDSPLCLKINILLGLSRGHLTRLQVPLSDLRRKPAKDKLRACTCKLRNAPQHPVHSTDTGGELKQQNDSAAENQENKSLKFSPSTSNPHLS